MMQYSKEGVKWKTAYEVCEMRKRLEGESNPRDRVRNKDLGRYVEVYAQTEEGVFCTMGCKGLGHPLGMFDVRAVQWEGNYGLEKAFTDAGYEIKRRSLSAK